MNLPPTPLRRGRVASSGRGFRTVVPGRLGIEAWQPGGLPRHRELMHARRAFERPSLVIGDPTNPPPTPPSGRGFRSGALGWLLRSEIVSELMRAGRELDRPV